MPKIRPRYRLLKKYRRFPVRLPRRRYSFLRGVRRRPNFLQILAGGTAAVLMLTFVSQGLLSLFLDKQHQLTPDMYRLVGESRDDTKEYLKMDQQGSAYSFSVPEMTAEEGGSVHTGRVDNAFSMSLGVNAKDGITVTDTATKINATLIPDFYARNAQKVEGDHLVYVSGRNKLVYTLKYNGLKEDIIIPSYQKDELTFRFKLQLPVGAEARLQSDGSIGIFSSDPSLFGNISFGSDEDRERVEKARENGDKTHLLMNIPAPLVKDGRGQEHLDKARFTLGEKEAIERRDNSAEAAQLPPEIPRSLISVNQYDLTLTGSQLKDLPYPISLDPTMVVRSASGFDEVNFEAGSEIDTANARIKRSSLTGGDLVSWGANSGQNMPVQNLYSRAPIACVYAGKVFITQANPSLTTVSFSVTNGIVGSMNTNAGPAPSYANGYAAGVCHNGYMYVAGGVTFTGTPFPVHANVQRAKLRSNGTIGAWNNVGTLGTAVLGAAAVVVNNYLYVVGGCTSAGSLGCATGTDAVQYAILNADGTLGTFQNTGSAIPGGNRARAHALHYNGQLYVMGGANITNSTVLTPENSTATNTIYYARPASSGNITSWQTSAVTLPTTRAAFGAIVASGYMYVYGGCTGNCIGGGNENMTTSYYTQLNADGSLGGWNSTPNLGTAVVYSPTVYVGGYILSVGGATNISGATQVTTIQSAQIKAAGNLVASTWNTGGTLTTTNEMMGRGVAAYNGFMYSTGGYKNDLPVGVQQTVEYAQINANGSTSGWQVDASSPLINARVYHNLIAYNGYLYAIGGCSSANLLGCGAVWNNFEYAQINADGTLGTWTVSGNNLTTNRATQGGAVYNGYLYLLGGSGGVSAGTTTEYAQLNPAGGDVVDPPGATPAWQPGPTIVSSPNTGAAVYNGYIYLAGGGSFGSPVNKVYVSQINSVNGTMGAFNDANATDMNGARAGGFGVTASKGYLYVWGGNAANSAEHVRINTDGTLGSWITATQGQSDPGFGGSYSSYASDGNVLTTINRAAGVTQYQTINNGGSGQTKNATLTISSSDWGTGRYDHASVVHQGYVYISSGRTISCTIPPNIGCSRTTIDTVRFGAINLTTGNVDTWQSTTSVPDGGRFWHQMVAVDQFMYVIGGKNSGGATVGDIYRASIDPFTGALSAWTDIGDYPHAVAEHAAAVTGNTIYVTGGYDNTATVRDTVYSTSVDASGNLSTWSSATSLPGVRRMHRIVAVADMLVITGGLWDASYGATSNIYSDVIVAKITAPGVLGSWQQTGFLPGGKRMQHVMAYANGYVYFGQGCSTAADIGSCAGNAINDMWLAPISPQGQLGVWLKTGTNDVARASQTAHVANGRIYAAGGCRANCLDDAGYVSNRLRYDSVQSIPRIGYLSRYYDFEAGVRPTKLIVRGDKQETATTLFSYINNNNAGSTWTNFGADFDVGYWAVDAKSLSLGASTTLSRYFALTFVIDDTYSSVFPDTGNESTITDFDVYYIANPGKRLRGGRTFTNGTDRGLGVQP